MKKGYFSLYEMPEVQNFQEKLESFIKNPSYDLLGGQTSYFGEVSINITEAPLPCKDPDEFVWSFKECIWKSLHFANAWMSSCSFGAICAARHLKEAKL
jgi:hypothetical protein